MFQVSRCLAIPLFAVMALVLTACVGARRPLHSDWFWSEECLDRAESAPFDSSIQHFGDRVVVSGPAAGHSQEFRLPPPEKGGCVLPFGDGAWLVYERGYGTLGYLWRGERWVAVDPNTAWHPDSDIFRADLYYGMSGSRDGRLEVTVQSSTGRFSCSGDIEEVGDPGFRVWWVGLDLLQVEGVQRRHLVRVALEFDAAGDPQRCGLHTVSPEFDVGLSPFLGDGPTDRFSQYRVLENWNRPPD